MKHLLQIFLNLILWFVMSLTHLFGVIWYGKLPKVSMYHIWNLEHNYSLYDVYNNKNIQSIKNPVMNERMILDLLSEVVKDCPELSEDISVPIRNKKGEIYDEQSLYSYLSDKFVEKMNEK